MGEAAVLQGVRQMRFEALLDRRERGELNPGGSGRDAGDLGADILRLARPAAR